MTTLAADHDRSISRRWHGRRETIGAGLWIVAVAVLQLPLVSAIVLFAPLVIVPLGLRLVERGVNGDLHQSLLQIANILQLPAAAALILAYALPTGVAAAICTVPWLVVTLLLAMLALLQLRSGRRMSAAGISRCAALAFPSIAGFWLLLFRLGWWPLGYQPVIVELTAVHFHYAGFALPLILSCVAAVLPGRGARLATAGVVLGIPLLAAGITFSPILEWIAALMLVGACLFVAFGQARLAVKARSPGQLVCFAASAVSLAAGMALALVYAKSELLAAAWIDIPTMIPLHGLANAFGFSLLGLLAWQPPYGDDAINTSIAP